MKKVIVLIGNYGSGKTELALNFAFKAAETGRTELLDLDMFLAVRESVPPFFFPWPHRRLVFSVLILGYEICGHLNAAACRQLTACLCPWA